MLPEILAALLAAFNILIGNMERDLEQAKALKAQMEAVEVIAPAPVDVNTTAELHSALAAATTGEVTIRLMPGVTYAGNFVINHTGPGVLTLTSYSGLPERRILPTDKPLLGGLESTNTLPALKIAPGSSYVNLDGLFLRGASSYDVLQIGTGNSEQDTLALVPHHVNVDRVHIDGENTGLNKRGIGLHGADVNITRSDIRGIWRLGQDSQAIGGWNGIGRYVIRDNSLEAASENFMLGGADPVITNLVAEDVLFEYNYVYKRPEWNVPGMGINVKNLFEIKAARRWTARFNIFEGNWQDGQSGYAVNIKTQNQDGTCNLCVTEDGLFEHNIVRNVGAGVSVLGEDYFWPEQQTTKRITIRQNLFEINGPPNRGDGRFLKMGGGPVDIVVENNTIIMTGDAVITSYRGNQKLADGTIVPAEPIRGFVFRNNLSRAGIYGFYVESFGSGGWSAVFDGEPMVTGNVLAAMPASHVSRYTNLPANIFPTEAEFNANFVDFANGDYRLVPGAYNGALVGADFSLLPN